MNDRPVVVLGAGGHARVLLDALASAGATVAGVVAPSAPEALPAPLLGNDAWLFAQDPSRWSLVNGLGSIASTALRAEVFARFQAAGFRFATVVHRGAIVAPDVTLGEGAQVMAGAILQTGVLLAENTLVNTGAQLDHDSVVGAHAHVAPGVVCSGAVRIGERAHIGAGAVVIQGRSVGAGALVGAGAVVIRDVEPDTTVYGNPARRVK